MKTRHQKGYVYKKGSGWYVRYYDYERQQDGSIKRVQKARKIAPVCDQYRTKRAVMALAEEFMLPLNSGMDTPQSTMTLEQFVEQTYLPHVESHKCASTYKGYKDIWKVHLKARCTALRLREFRTCDGEQLLAEIARQNDLSRNTLKRIKSLLSGIFKQARRLGVLNAANPMRDVSIPKGRESGDTYAYSLEEVRQMLTVLPEPSATIVATAAFTGLRRGELRGLLWENYNGAQVRVTQCIWEGHIHEPKTGQSKAPVPVIDPLAKKLESYRLTQGNPRSGLMFASRNGMPVDLKNLAYRVIRPLLNKAGLDWYGWHAFRRGLATNLYRLGVPDKGIQVILRHANISTTMNIYVKSVPADAVAAMRSLEQICTQYAPADDSSGGYVA